MTDPCDARAPRILIETAWPYHPKGKTSWQAPNGTLTLAGDEHGLPNATDKYVALYLSDRAKPARTGLVVRGSCRDLCEWLGATWRRRDIIKRLRRVLSCSLMVPNRDGEYRMFRFGKLRAVRGDRFVVALSPEFADAIETGIAYDRVVARVTRRSPTTFDHYLICQYFCSLPAAERYDPHKLLSRAASDGKARQTLQEHMMRVRAIDPDVPFVAVGLHLVLHAHLREEARRAREHRAEKRRQAAAEIDAIRELPPRVRRSRAHARPTAPTPPPSLPRFMTRIKLRARDIERRASGSSTPIPWPTPPPTPRAGRPPPTTAPPTPVSHADLLKQIRSIPNTARGFVQSAIALATGMATIQRGADDAKSRAGPTRAPKPTAPRAKKRRKRKRRKKRRV